MKQKYEVKCETTGIVFSSGTIGKQSNGAVVVSLGETQVFVSATAATSTREGQDFFPLTVDYREKFAAAGKFPGGYLKREARPSEKEVLTSRLCDRPLRPLFDKGFLNEVQVIGLLLSADKVNDADVLMVNGASAALIASDIPWAGPVGCIRLGDVNGEFVVNPTFEQREESVLDLIYVGTKTEMLMIEGAADEVTEARFVEALTFAQNAIQPIIETQEKLGSLVGKTKKEFTLQKASPELVSKIDAFFGARVFDSLSAAKTQNTRKEANSLLLEEAIAEFSNEEVSAGDVSGAFEAIVKKAYRSNILNSQKRMDGRGVDELRALSCDTDVLPRVHGTGLFERGETQTVVMATLGTSKDNQNIDSITGGASEKSFILHYNFPPFSVGETGRFGMTGRREIGHGALAERSLLPVLPDEDAFPYSIRLVSEIMESNGSTSMASVCGGTLALLDAGVPITGHVAGISCGIVTEHEGAKISKYELLTDIIGSEDHFGDMDFKICGSRKGITGFQLDLKIPGLPLDIAAKAISQIMGAKAKVLDVMEAHKSATDIVLKDNAPRIHSLNIDPEQIGLLIGPGGKTIRRITEVSGAQIDITDDTTGKISIYATDEDSMLRAKEEINLLTAKIEAGKIYRSVVRSIKDFGVFVECLPGQEGLVHVSELANFRVENAGDVCSVGEEMIVKCLEIDAKGRCRLSRKAVLEESE